MARVFLALLVFVQLIVLNAKSAELPEDVKAGYFAGRSGNVIVKPSSATPADMRVMFFDVSGEHLDTSAFGASMSAPNLADVITRSLGVQPINEEYTPVGVKTNIFKSPKANLLLSLESVGADMLEKHSLTNLMQMGNSVELNYPVFPRNSVSLSASIATGKYPSVHGIVEKNWLAGEPVWAYVSGANAAPQVASVSDILSQSFNGQSLILSASADSQLAFAHCPNYALLTANPEWNALCVSQHPKNYGMTAMGPEATGKKVAMEAAFVADKDVLLAQLTDASSSVLSNLKGGVSASIEGTTVTVSFPAGSQAFSLSSPEDLSLFLELQYMYSMPQRLTSDSVRELVEDDVPDSYAFAFAAVSSLVRKYGKDSQEVAAALKLTDAAIPQILAGMNALYPSSMVGEVVLLGSPVQPCDKMLAAVPGVISTQYFPNLYSTKAAEACDLVSQKLSQFDADVYCASPVAPRPVGLSAYRMKLAAVNGTDLCNGQIDPTSNCVELYQIELWVSIGGVFIVFWAASALAFMGFKKDTLLYGNFNPNWEDRKRR